MSTLTHLDAKGQAHMVDIGDKESTSRAAVASARLRVGKQLHALIASNRVPKGDAFAVARIAGIMGAKRTAELIPLCHPIALHSVAVDLQLQARAVVIRATVTTFGRTGVEMEAMTAASVAALTFYDMCKSLDRSLAIVHVRLEEKRGGKSGTFRRKRSP